MADRLGALEELTHSLLSRINRVGYEELEAFVEQREAMTAELAISFSGRKPELEEQERLKELLDYDPIIRGRMQMLALEASQWLMNRNQSKRQRFAYESSYSPDSMLMDRRK